MTSMDFPIDIVFDITSMVFPTDILSDINGFAHRYRIFIGHQ